MNYLAHTKRLLPAALIGAAGLSLTAQGFAQTPFASLRAHFLLDEAYTAGSSPLTALNIAPPSPAGGIAVNGSYSSGTSFTADGCILGATWQLAEQEFMAFSTYSGLELLDDDFSLSFWVANEYDFDNGAVLLVGARNSSALPGSLAGWGVALAMGPDGMTPELRYGDVSSLCTTAVTFPITFPADLPCNTGPNPTNFRHVALRVLDNTQGTNAIVECFIDGVSTSPSSNSGNVFTATPDGTATWYVGGAPAPAAGGQPISCANNFAGQIVDLQIYDGQLTNAQIGRQYLSPGSTTLGSNPTCPTVANSTGSPATVTAFGSDVETDNFLFFDIVSVPADKPGYFLMSLSEGLVLMPGGSAGNLCLGGPIARLNDANQIWRSDATGYASLQLDLEQNYTMATVSTAWAAGTFYFQGWHRDPGIAGGNFTNSIEIVLQ